MIIEDTFDPDAPSRPVDWPTVPLPLLVDEAADPDGDPDALTELARRGAP